MIDSETLLKIFIVIIYAIFGLIAATAKLSPQKWQFWGLLLCLVLVHILSGMQGR